MEWLGGLAVVAIFLGIGWLWEVASESRGATGVVARALGNVTESVAGAIEHLAALALGVGLILLGLVGLLLPLTDGAWRWLGTPFLIGAGAWIVMTSRE